MDDPVSVALMALCRVSNVVAKLGAEHRRSVLGTLATQLLLVAEYLDDTAGRQEAKKVVNRLKPLETICSVSHQHPC